MMRLTVHAQTSEVVVLAVHGKIVGPDVEILAAEGRRHLQVADRLILVLDGVQFIDEAGLALLRRWSGPRLELRGGSVFLRALLVSQGLVLDG